MYASNKLLFEVSQTFFFSFSRLEVGSARNRSGYEALNLKNAPFVNREQF